MSDTLSRIRAKTAQQSESQDQELSEEVKAQQALHDAAKPLLNAFDEVRNEPLRIDVMKQLWPDDYDQRDDKAETLLIGLIGPTERPCGLGLKLPGGSRYFQVERTLSGDMTYVTVREALSGAPHIRNFGEPTPWLEAFYSSMATVLEL